MMQAVIHVNPGLEHQVRFGMAFADGFDRLGISRTVTANRAAAGDLHVCLGPHYAASQWTNHQRTLLLDRGFFGDEKRDVSLGWMRQDGGRRFSWGDSSRWRHSRQVLEPLRAGDRGAIFLADYAEDRHVYARLVLKAREIHTAVWYRPHPAQTERWPACPVAIDSSPSLEAAIAKADTAIGFRTSALVTAGLAGLHLEAHDSGAIASLWHPDYRERWADAVAWANWNQDEVTSGAAIDYLLRIEQQPAASLTPC